MMADKKNEL